MSTFADQIKAACATIAENQQKIYEKRKSEGTSVLEEISISISENGEHIISPENADGMSKCTVTVEIPEYDGTITVA